MTTRIEKTFDAVAFKRKVQSEIYEETKDMSPRERIAYFRRAARTGPLADWWRRISGSEQHHEPPCKP